MLHVLKALQKYVIHETFYDGRVYLINEGCPTVIESGSIDELIIADWMEQGLIFRNTNIIVKEHRLDENKLHSGISAVYNMFRRMNPIITRIKQIIPGSK